MAACWMPSRRHISISKLDLARPDPWTTWLALTSAASALHDQVMMVAWASGEVCALPPTIFFAARRQHDPARTQTHPGAVLACHWLAELGGRRHQTHASSALLGRRTAVAGAAAWMMLPTRCCSSSRMPPPTSEQVCPASGCRTVPRTTGQMGSYRRPHSGWRARYPVQRLGAGQRV